MIEYSSQTTTRSSYLHPLDHPSWVRPPKSYRKGAVEEYAAQGIGKYSGCSICGSETAFVLSEMETRKITGTSCKTEIHFFIQTTKFVMKYK